jgi:hypothetical protein
MTFLKSDLAKVIGLCLASVAGVLLPLYPPPNTIGVVSSVALAILTGLGIVSGGVAASQPKLPPAP